MIKCKSDQVFTEKYDYTLTAGVNELFFFKARHQEVLIIRNICIFNPTQSNSGVCYKVMRRRGRIFYLNHVAAINAGVVQQWAIPVYLIDGDEIGIEITPNAEGDDIEVVVQGLRMRDDEYFKAT